MQKLRVVRSASSWVYAYEFMFPVCESSVVLNESSSATSTMRRVASFLRKHASYASLTAPTYSIVEGLWGVPRFWQSDTLLDTV